MLKRLARLYVVFVILLCGSAAYAQVRVYVEGTAEDAVGSRLVYAFKEGIRHSSGLKLADRDKNGHIRVLIVTLDPDKNGGGGNRTVYSIVWTMQTFHETPVEMFLDTSVGVCGSSKVAECADRLVADTDTHASMMKAAVQSILEKNKK